VALSSQTANFISELTQLAEELLDKQRQIDILISRWNQNDVFNRIEDADIAAVFPHLTRAEVANAVTAITGVTTALGDLISGQAVNLVKMKG
jgi:hypothetical protein